MENKILLAHEKDIVYFAGCLISADALQLATTGSINFLRYRWVGEL